MWRVLVVCVLTYAQQIELPHGAPQLMGRMLVATAKSQDRDLGRSVVLVIHCDIDGVMGLVVNHPVSRTNPPTWFGGPIPMDVRELFRSRVKPEGAERIFGDVYLTRKIDDRAGSRVYAGYAGWSLAQWNDEVARGLWKIVPASSDLVFDAHPETLWRRLR
jgi:putative transcriptional regulator